MYKCKNCGNTVEDAKPLQDGDVLCPACAGECTDESPEFLSDEGVVLINGVMPFEIETICKKLERANIRFSIRSPGANESGIINVRPDNAAAGLTNIANAFSSGGLSTYYQISVATEDYEKARELIGQGDAQAVESEPPPESAFTDSDPASISDVGPKGIWGWNTIPILNLIALAGGAFFLAATQHFPAFFNGTMWAFWTKGCEAYNAPLGYFIATELAYNLFLATAAIYALILVARRSVTYPRWTTKLFWISAVGAGIDLGVAHYFNIEITAKEKQEVFRGTVFALIWMAYFSKSVRIKNTFVNASVKLRKVFATAAVVIAVSALFCWIGMRSNNPLTNVDALKTYICFLQTRESAGAEKKHVGCTGLVPDALFAEKTGEIELRLKAALRKMGSDDVGVALNDQDDIVLAYSLKEKITDATLQKIIDEAELPIKLDVIEQREYVPEESKK